MFFVEKVQDSLVVRELIDDVAEINVLQKVSGLELVQWDKIWFAKAARMIEAFLEPSGDERRCYHCPI